MIFLNFIIGLALLLAGSELLVKGASRISALLGISPLIIGLTVVAFGTSSPEMIVSVKAGLAGNAQIAMGNVIGSNIFNILFILGLSALIRPLKVYVQLIRWDVPIMIMVSLLFLIFTLNGKFGKLEGGILFGGLFAYLVLQILLAGDQQKIRKSPDTPVSSSTFKNPLSPWLLNAVFVIGGLFLLVFGSNLFITGAISIAKILGVSELLIGLTLVSVGTSLPEVATSLMASVRGETDISVGNIVGSNIFNLLGVSGLAGLVSADNIIILPQLGGVDIPLMLLVALACLPIFFTGAEISRWEGGLFFGFYILYLVYLILQALASSILSGFTVFVFWIVLPVTILIMLFDTLKSIRKRNKKEHSS